MIDEENKVAPYTDEELSDLLAEKGYAVARRTVTKYRELLGFSNGLKEVSSRYDS